MIETKTYDEWVEIAKSLDFIEGNEGWKNNKVSNLYNYKKIENRYKNMK